MSNASTNGTASFLYKKHVKFYLYDTTLHTTYMYTWAHTYIHYNIYTHAHIYTGTHIHKKSTHAHTYTKSLHMHTHTQKVYTCTHIHIHTHAYTHTKHLHTHTHTVPLACFVHYTCSEYDGTHGHTHIHGHTTMQQGMTKEDLGQLGHWWSHGTVKAIKIGFKTMPFSPYHTPG